MRFFSLLAVTVSCEKVIVQPKSNCGYGTEISFGTPAQTIFVSPDFGSPLTRLFVGPSVRYAFFPAISPSTSAVAAQAVPAGSPSDGKRKIFTDRVSLGGVEVPNVEMSRETGRATADMLETGDSLGRIALGPTSRISQSHLIKLESETVAFPDGERAYGFSIELIQAVSETTQGQRDIVFETVDRPDGWIAQGQVVLNERDVTGGELQLIEFDPTAMGIEVPHSVMDGIVTSLSGHIDMTGRLMVDCSEDGKMSSKHNLYLRLGDGQIINIDLGRQVPVDQVMRNSRDGSYSCPSEIRVRMPSSGFSGKWRITPFMIPGVETVFLNGHGRQMTFRFFDRTIGFKPKAEMPALIMPRVPLFGKIDIQRSAHEDTVLIRATDRDASPPILQFTVGKLKAVKHPDGSLHFGFIRSKGHSFTMPKTVKMGSGYVLGDGETVLEVADPVSLNLRLNLRKGEDGGANGTKYSLLMTQTSFLMALVLVPE